MKRILDCTTVPVKLVCPSAFGKRGTRSLEIRG
jgi:hypothetical protein